MPGKKDDVKFQEECGTCKYWKPFEDGKGECHHKAPSPCIHEPGQKTIHKGARWPLTGEHEHCGEYQRSKEYPRRAGVFLKNK
jgi:hypothetical protein